MQEGCESCTIIEKAMLQTGGALHDEEKMAAALSVTVVVRMHPAERGKDAGGAAGDGGGIHAGGADAGK